MKIISSFICLIIFVNTEGSIFNEFNIDPLDVNQHRYKRQAGDLVEKTYFDKNEKAGTSRSSKIISSRSVLDGVPVSPDNIRLRSDGRSNANEGRVEFYNEKTKKWGLICDDYWMLSDANVTCRQLGFVRAAREATRQDHHGRGNWLESDYTVERIKCQGNEGNILQCSHVLNSKCSGKSAGVSCIYNSGCLYGWLSYSGACYKIVNKPLKFKEAEMYCQDEGAKLIYILQVPENNFISNTLYLQFPKVTKVWTGGYYSDVKLESGKNEKRWNWYSTIHSVNRWNTSGLWFPGFDGTAFDKRPSGDLETKSCIALSRAFVDSLRYNQMYDVNYYWWDNLSCNEKLPFICQKNIPRGRTDCYEGTGTSYRGTMSRTNQGTSCAKWSHPQITVNANTHPNAGLGDHNYCRNPDNDVMPWCWVNPSQGVYGYCAMEKCSEAQEPVVTLRPPTTGKPGMGLGGCQSNQLYCPSMVAYNRQCLSNQRVCDQVPDCNGLEDENPEFCKTFYCKENEFYCSADTFCILKSYMCDGKKNCADGEDERNCTIIDESQITEVFQKFSMKTLVSKDKLMYYNIPIQQCMDNCRIVYPLFPCRSFNFFPPNETRIYSECQLLKILQSEEPQKLEPILYPGSHYSLIVDCPYKFQCTSGMCISTDKKCDNRNDCGDNSDETNCPMVTFPPFEIRLTGSKDEWEGKVEIRYQGEWGFICDNKFDLNAAHVVCKQLGFIEAFEAVQTAGSRFGRVRNAIILLDGLKCTGSEYSIEECPHDAWRKHGCKAEEISGVVCKVDRACTNSEFRCQKDKSCIKMSQICDGIKHCSDGSDEPEGKCTLRIKLLNGPDSNSGRVEVSGPFTKGTICDDGITNKDAAVICRMLGIPGRAEVVVDRRFGEGRGEIVLANLNCNGDETTLRNCPSFKWGEHKCSHKEDIGVLCGLKNVQNVVTTTLAPLKKTDQVRGVTCGRKPITQKRGRVVGGFETIYGAFPWQVGVRNRYDDYDIHWCGGTILSEDWIISAAHCYERPKHQYLVRTGDWNNNEQDTYEQQFEVEELILNPKYQGPPTYDFDLALIKIKRNNGIGILLNDHVQPACLPRPGDVPDARTKCLVSGWGETQAVTADKLLAAEVPLVKTERCREFYPDRISDRMQCAGYEAGGIDTCQGDSGGPLVCQVNGIYTIFGATSWGDGCAQPRSPGVYAKVETMLDFVRQNTGF